VEGEKRAYDILVDETDPAAVNFEFDSYWFAEGGADASAWMRRLGRRMKLWHINDRGTRLSGPAMTPILKTDSLELGTGNLPLEAWAALAGDNGVETVVLESHRNWIDKSAVKSMQASARWLNEHL
jgi:sugar phosphate isomerase/epimerase